jgi:hypothetical protein
MRGREMEEKWKRERERWREGKKAEEEMRS